MKTKIKLIVAFDENRGIGFENELLYHDKDDMKHFTETTKNGIVIMGRKTWESLPQKFRPLPDRVNVVLSRDENFNDKLNNLHLTGIYSFNTIDKVLSLCNKLNRDVYVIGGASIYKQFLDRDLVDGIIATKFNLYFYPLKPADVYFPEINKSKFERVKTIQQLNSGDMKTKFWINYYDKKLNFFKSKSQSEGRVNRGDIKILHNEDFFGGKQITTVIVNCLGDVDTSIEKLKGFGIDIMYINTDILEKHKNDDKLASLFSSIDSRNGLIIPIKEKIQVHEN